MASFDLDAEDDREGREGGRSDVASLRGGHPPAIGVREKAEFRHAPCRVSRPWKPVRLARGRGGRETGPQLAVVPTVRQWNAGNRGQGTAGPPLAAELTIASTVQRVALSGGRGCFQAGWQRALHHVPGGEGEGREEGWLACRHESEREEGMDGRKREGNRFVSAEIGRVAPRREPSAEFSVPL